MKAHFTIEISNFKSIEVLPNNWTTEDYKAIMQTLNFGDVSKIAAADLKEMCYLCLADEAPEVAATVVLTHVFNERLNRNQIDQLSHEIQAENMWEEYADLSMHEEFFNVGQLLFNAYNGKFPHPQAVTFNVNIKTNQKNIQALLNTFSEIEIIRILTQAMPPNTLLKRLFGTELEGGVFDEAKNIIWQYKKLNDNNDTLSLEIISSSYFFQDLKFVDNFEAELELEEAD